MQHREPLLRTNIREQKRLKLRQSLIELKFAKRNTSSRGISDIGSRSRSLSQGQGMVYQHLQMPQCNVAMCLYPPQGLAPASNFSIYPHADSILISNSAMLRVSRSYWLRTGLRDPLSARFFSSRPRSKRFWSLPILLSNM